MCLKTNVSRCEQRKKNGFNESFMELSFLGSSFPLPTIQTSFRLNDDLDRIALENYPPKQLAGKVGKNYRMRIEKLKQLSLIKFS